MRTAGRSPPRRGARDHIYNKPVVPSETFRVRSSFAALSEERSLGERERES